MCTYFKSVTADWNFPVQPRIFLIDAFVGLRRVDEHVHLKDIMWAGFLAISPVHTLRIRFMFHSIGNAVAGCILASAAFGQVASADTITVCPDGSCDFTDPAAAAASAVPGDVIEIAAGTYLLEEPVAFITQQVTIRGAVDSYGEPATILDGQGALIVLGTAYADQAVFENLVITNGYGDYGGGSRFIASSDVVVRNSHFVGNHADWNGAGVRLSLDTTLTLIDCEIAGNTANHPTWPGQSYGAGIHNSGGTVVLETTRVCGNVESWDPGRQVTGDEPVLVGGCITDECDSCEIDEMDADLDSDGSVGVNDLLLVIASWGESGSADIDGDGTVGVTDLLAVISAWG